MEFYYKKKLKIKRDRLFWNIIPIKKLSVLLIKAIIKRIISLMSFSVFKLSKLSKLPNSNLFTVYSVTGESNGLISNRLKTRL